MLMNDVLRKKPDFVYVKMRVVKIYSSLIYVYCCLRSFRIALTKVLKMYMYLTWTVCNRLPSLGGRDFKDTANF